MNKSVKLGPDFMIQRQPSAINNPYFYGGYQKILYNPYLKPISPESRHQQTSKQQVKVKKAKGRKQKRQ